MMNVLIVERVPLVAQDLMEIISECRPDVAVHILRGLPQMNAFLGALETADLAFVGVEAEQRARLFAHEALRQGVKRVVITDRVTPPGPLAPGWCIEPRPIVPEAVRRHVQALVAPAA
jgi:DNA-binding LytR/AlgR family response regulator